MGIVNPLHLAFVAVVALIVLGPKRLPELARSLGHGMREFRESLSEGASGEERSGEERSASPAVASAPAIPPQAQLAPLPESVDPAQAIRSGDAPDRGSL